MMAAARRIVLSTIAYWLAIQRPTAAARVSRHSIIVAFFPNRATELETSALIRFFWTRRMGITGYNPILRALTPVSIRMRRALLTWTACPVSPAGQ
jgi:hypothetical protein